MRVERTTAGDVPGRRPRSGLELLEDLIPRFDLLLRELELTRENSTAALDSLRGVHNQMLFAGTVILQTAALVWAQDFVVPFASVLVADLQGAGPLTVSTDASGAALGAGSLTIPLNGFASVPLIGRHVSIAGSVANKPVFVAIYTTPQSPAFGQI